MHLVAELREQPHAALDGVARGGRAGRGRRAPHRADAQSAGLASHLGRERSGGWGSDRGITGEVAADAVENRRRVAHTAGDDVLGGARAPRLADPGTERGAPA